MIDNLMIRHLILPNKITKEENDIRALHICCKTLITHNPTNFLLTGLPKLTLTADPQSPVFTGDSVTLRCEGIQSQNGWEFLWRKDSNPESTEDQTKTIKPEKVSDGGKYSCRARRGGYYTDYSKPVTVTVYERPKPRVNIKPDQHVFRGETVTLRCDIYDEGVTSWRYSWYKYNSRRVFRYGQEHTFSSVTESVSGEYSCEGSEIRGSRRSHTSDKVTLTVSDPKSVLSVSPQKWLTEGDPVTLICEVHNFSTGWTFSWFTLTQSPEIQSRISFNILSGFTGGYHLLSDSSRGAGGRYRISSAAVDHTGVYVCRAEREKSSYKTQYSNKQLLWVTGVSAPVSLRVSPSRTQHFRSDSLSLSCEDQSNSTVWRVRRYTDSDLEDCSSISRGSHTGSTCTISYVSTSHTGVYWCESESGEKHHPVNITVHSEVILESPVHPVTEGDSLTLRCLYQYTTPSNLRADFYKDGSLIQNQTTEMIISPVSKSHEGFYSCKHPERGESPKSWISVRLSASTGSVSEDLKPMIIGVTAGLTAVFIVVFLVLLWCYRNNKGVKTRSPSTVSQTSDQNQSNAGYKTLLTGTAHIYASVDAADNNDSESSEHMYAEIELKSTNEQKKNKENKENKSESSECFYSKLTLKTDQGAGSSDVTYVEVD
ncbi:Fc receptor-like protein 5 [Puntigrus tetrazona]|uniref:Fc receptor-like protein 5 n=1 Tax=Puntigrus tetrazona TaxID=1606681 RepID=UPI001C89A5E9|nr:Fc receptor-like protein 5 [Puntigrus tetrazona]